MPAASKNPVLVGPGQSTVTEIPVPSHFVCKGVREGNDERLTGIIQGHERAGDKRRRGSDIENASAAAGNHLRQEQSGEVGHRDEIDLNQPVPGLPIDPGEESEKADTRVIHEDLDGLIAHGFEDGVARAGAGEIAGQHTDSDTVTVHQIGGELLQQVPTARDKDQVVAAGGAEPGQFGADPTRGSGDERRAAGHLLLLL